MTTHHEYEGYDLEVYYDHDWIKTEPWCCSVNVPTHPKLFEVCAYLSTGHKTQAEALSGGKQAVDQGWLTFNRCPVCDYAVPITDRFCAVHEP